MALRDENSINELYLLAFSRLPVAQEMKAADDYIEKIVSRQGGNAPSLRRAAYEDLIWVLMNTKEFSFNH